MAPKINFAALAATVLGLTVAACAGTAATTTTTPPPALAASAAAAPAARDIPLGGTATFPSGVAVTATAERQPAGQYASGAQDGKVVVVTLKIHNGSSQAINAAAMSVPTVSYGTEGTRAEIALDAAHMPVVGSTVLQGETQTVTAVYGVPAAGLASLRVEVRGDDLTEQPAVFKGAVK